MEPETVTEIVSLLRVQNQFLEGLLVVVSLSLGSLLFIHFGRFMRW